MSTNDDQPTATSYLQRNMLAAMQQYERDFAAANSSPTIATLLNLAQSYDRATTDAHRAELAAEVAKETTLAEAGNIRRAAAAIQLATPGIIVRANTQGTDTTTIARELGVTPRYVRRIIQEAAVEAYERGLADGAAALAAEQQATSDNIGERLLNETSATIDAARREARKPARDTRRVQVWRLDQKWDADELPAGNWHTVTTGGPITGGRPRSNAEMAAYIVERERRHQPSAATLRVTVWQDGDESTAATAYAEPVAREPENSSAEHLREQLRTELERHDREIQARRRREAREHARKQAEAEQPNTSTTD